MTRSCIALLCAFGCASAPSSESDSTTTTEASTGGEVGGGEVESSEQTGDGSSGISPTATATTAPEPFSCTRVDLVSVQVPRSAYENRNGSGVTRFSGLETSMEKPMEGCGLGEVLGMLAMLKCDDGSNPYSGDPRAAHASRVGSMGGGGRCGSILDLCTAQCAEGPDEVYADMYCCAGS